MAENIEAQPGQSPLAPVTPFFSFRSSCAVSCFVGISAWGVSVRVGVLDSANGVWHHTILDLKGAKQTWSVVVVPGPAKRRTNQICTDQV